MDTLLTAIMDASFVGGDMAAGRLFILTGARPCLQLGLGPHPEPRAYGQDAVCESPPGRSARRGPAGVALGRARSRPRHVGRTRVGVRGQVPSAENATGDTDDSPRAVKVLTEHREQVSRHEPGDLVFGNRKGEPFRESKLLTRAGQPAAVEAGLEAA